MAKIPSLTAVQGPAPRVPVPFAGLPTPRGAFGLARFAAGLGALGDAGARFAEKLKRARQADELAEWDVKIIQGIGQATTAAQAAEPREIVDVFQSGIQPLEAEVGGITDPEVQRAVRNKLLVDAERSRVRIAQFQVGAVRQRAILRDKEHVDGLVVSDGIRGTHGQFLSSIGAYEESLQRQAEAGVISPEDLDAIAQRGISRMIQARINAVDPEVAEQLLDDDLAIANLTPTQIRTLRNSIEIDQRRAEAEADEENRTNAATLLRAFNDDVARSIQETGAPPIDMMQKAAEIKANPVVTASRDELVEAALLPQLVAASESGNVDLFAKIEGAMPEQLTARGRTTLEKERKQLLDTTRGLRRQDRQARLELEEITLEQAEAETRQEIEIWRKDPNDPNGSPPASGVMSRLRSASEQAAKKNEVRFRLDNGIALGSGMTGLANEVFEMEFLPVAEEKMIAEAEERAAALGAPAPGPPTPIAVMQRAIEDLKPSPFLPEMAKQMLTSYSQNPNTTQAAVDLFTTIETTQPFAVTNIPVQEQSFLKNYRDRVEGGLDAQVSWKGARDETFPAGELATSEMVSRLKEVQDTFADEFADWMSDQGIEDNVQLGASDAYREVVEFLVRDKFTVAESFEQAKERIGTVARAWGKTAVGRPRFMQTPIELTDWWTLGWANPADDINEELARTLIASRVGLKLDAISEELGVPVLPKRGDVVVGPGVPRLAFFTDADLLPEFEDWVTNHIEIRPSGRRFPSAGRTARLPLYSVFVVGAKPGEERILLQENGLPVLFGPQFEGSLAFDRLIVTRNRANEKATLRRLRARIFKEGVLIRPTPFMFLRPGK